VAPGSGSDVGVLAISARPGEPCPDAATIAGSVTSRHLDVSVHGSNTVVSWGLDGTRLDGVDGAVVWPLSRGIRSADHDLTITEVAARTRDGATSLADVMPPFAAVTADTRRLSGVVDAMGARHLYVTEGVGWAAVSTHPQALARARGGAVDREAIAVQMMLGWQVGTRTMFEDVRKVTAGCAAVLDDGKLVESSYLPPAPPAIDLDAAVDEAAQMLRSYLHAYLDDHPDATLQLTGGQDSRILLSAIPPERRRHVRAMTLSVPGSDDVRIAAAFARQFEMDHTVITLSGIDEWTPEDAHERVLAAGRQLGGMADPIALAALRFAESKIEQGPRISGLGGEVARGFYYMLPAIGFPVSKRTVSLLADWRMFANESAAAAAFDPAFRRWAVDFAHDEILRLFVASGGDIRTASDAFYLEQRMQRWAGITDSAVCFDRDVVNPMLDRRFLDIARGLSVADKRNSRFLGRLQIALDEDLADVPLDGRPPPRAYAHRTFASTLEHGSSFGRRAVRKARQRAGARRKPPAGGTDIAPKVVAHWRAQPEILSVLHEGGVMDPDWVDRVAAGTIEPDSATVAFMVNLLVTQHDVR
jgi:asparagine synthase (glutamine-hydrolysing)